MRHRVEHDVDAHRVRLQRKAKEILVLFRFALPAIRDVRVVGHEHHETTVVVEDAAKVRLGGLEASLGCASPAGAPPIMNRRNLRDLADRIEGTEDDVVERHIDDGIVVLGKHFVDLTLPVLPCGLAPEIVNNPLYQDPMNVAPVSVGTIRGGSWHSTVADEVLVEGRYGVLPGETIETAKTIFLKALQKTIEKDTWLAENPPIVEWFEGQFESGQTALNHPFIQTLAKCHSEMIGKKSELEGVTYGSDLRLFTNHGKMPAVLYGPGDVKNAHAVNEYVSLDEVLNCVKVLALTIYEWCEAL